MTADSLAAAHSTHKRLAVLMETVPRLASTYAADMTLCAAAVLCLLQGGHSDVSQQRLSPCEVWQVSNILTAVQAALKCCMLIL